MATDFFEQQASARRRTNGLRLVFVLAVLLVAFLVALVISVGLAGAFKQKTPFWLLDRPAAFASTAMVMLVIIALVAGAKAWRLRNGGIAVAEMMGGVPVSSRTDNPRLRQLQNIVDEMALAAHMPAPLLFVLPGERNINAFAAGWHPQSAVVAVTEGALNTFDRSEMQAVIGHEFSHIRNGDMALNTRLIAWQAGLYAFTDIARFFLRKNEKTGMPDLRVLMFAPLIAGLYGVGIIGRLVGRLLQAAISRRREQLADASAVQFTRNPQALKSALIKIAARPGGGLLRAASTADMAHLFFAAADGDWFNRLSWSWLHTHPPLPARIQALDMNVTPARLKTLIREEREQWQARASRMASLPPFGPAAPVPEVPVPQDPVPQVSVLAAAVAAAAAAIPGDALHNRLTREQQRAIAVHVATARTSINTSVAFVLAALLAAHTARRDALRAKLAPLFGDEILGAVTEAQGPIDALDPIARLPLVVNLLPAVLQAEAAVRARLLAATRAFARLVEPGETYALALTRVLSARLAPAAGAPALGTLPQCAHEVGLLLSLLAQQGTAPELAYKAGIQGLLPPQGRPAFTPTPIAPAELDAALARLALLHPSGRRAVGEALVRIIGEDQRLTAAEADLLRLACVVMDCTLPGLPLNTLYHDVRDAHSDPAAAPRTATSGTAPRT